jgi:RNase P subunit RPR2
MMNSIKTNLNVFKFYFINFPLWKKTYCSTCRNLFTDLEQIRFIHEIGECANCDHNRYSILEEVYSYEEKEE